MRINQLKYFIEVANTKSMKTASNNLYISPQNISKAIGQLEEEFKTTLFKRTRKGLFLTTDGEVVYASAKKIMHNVTNLETYFKTRRSNELLELKGDLKIYSSIGGGYFLSSISKSMLTYHPEVNVKITEENLFKKIMKKISMPENDTKLIYCCIPHDKLQDIQKYFNIHDYHSNILSTESLQVFMHRNAPLAKEEFISIKALSNLPMVSYYNDENEEDFYDKVFENYGVNIKYVFNSNNLDLCLSYLLNNIAYNLNTKTVVNPMLNRPGYSDITCRPLQEDIVLYNILFSKNTLLSAEEQTFANLIKSYFGQTVTESVSKG